MVETLYIGKNCSILREGTFRAKYKVEYNQARDTYTLYAKFGKTKFKLVTSTNDKAKIIDLLKQYEIGDNKFYNLLDLGNSMNELEQHRTVYREEQVRIKAMQEDKRSNKIISADVKQAPRNTEKADEDMQPKKKNTWTIWDNGIPTTATINNSLAKIKRDLQQDRIESVQISTDTRTQNCDTEKDLSDNTINIKAEEPEESKEPEGLEEAKEGDIVDSIREVIDSGIVQNEGVESVEAEYFGYDKKPEKSSSAIWRILDGHLELREHKGKWAVVPTIKDPYEALESYNRERIHYYDALGFPLDIRDKSFALYKCIEYHNGLVVQLRRRKKTRDWKYDKLRPSTVSRFKYYDKNFAEISRTGIEGFEINYRLRRDNPNGYRTLHIDRIDAESNWSYTSKDINGININCEMVAALKWASSTRYYDENGNECTEGKIVYKVIKYTDDYSRLYIIDSNNEWNLHGIGSYITIRKELNKLKSLDTQPIQVNDTEKSDTNKDSSKSDIKDGQLQVKNIKGDAPKLLSQTRDYINILKPINTSTTPQQVVMNYNKLKSSSNLVSKIYERLADKSKFTQEDLGAYLTTCVIRNRRIHKNPIINTRLFDRINQPIFIYDYGYERSTNNINLDNIWIIESLEQAKSMCKEVEIDSLPEPLQWSSNPYDYIWNPLISISPISKLTYDIIQSQFNKLHENLRDKDISVIMHEIRHSCEEGERIAKTDIAFALPFYNIEHDSVSMMLPLKSKILSGEKVLNAMLFDKSLGYSLYGIITVEEALKSVRLFRNPSNTWLMQEEK